MATYKEIKGVTIQTRAKDPTVNAGTWSSQSGMNEGRKALSGFGTYTAAIAATGNDPSTVNSVESWDGSSWTEIAEVNTAKFYRGNNGTQTAGLLIGGAPATTDTEEWNGASWTETANYPATMSQIIQLGTQTAAFAVGGATAPGPYTNATNTYNGASFTSSTAINTARAAGIGSGSTTAAVVAGGTTGSASNTTELWNGSSWTEVNELNTARDLLAGSGSSSTNSLAFGGLSTALTSTESWNGTSWTEVNDLGTGRRELGGSTNGSNTQALAFSGATSPGAVQTATEQWTFPSGPHLNEGDLFLSGGTTLKGFGKAAGVPSGVWSSGGSMSSSREQGADFGSLVAGVAAGGGGSSTDVEEYNGTSWSEGTELGTAGAAGGATGSQTAGIIFGYAQSTPLRVDTMTYNGTGFTEANNMNTGRNVGGSVGGLQTAAIYAGGSSSIDNVEQWNGSTWSEVSEINDGRYFLKGGGTVTAAVLAGGYGGSPSTNPAQSETWNGASWSEGNELNTGRAFLTGGGSEYTSAMIFGGGPPVIDNTEFWNGTSWTEMNDMATASETSHGTTQGTGAGTYRARTPAGGATEEWTVEAALSTVTVS